MDNNRLAELLYPSVTEAPADIDARYPQRTLPDGAVVSRAAPSPTGFVHLGNLVQGLTSERMAHQSGGVMFLRVEDTDSKREVPGAVEELIDGLKNYGIVFDEGATAEGDNGQYGPYRQRQRATIYHVYAKKLVLEGKAYPCFCTEQDLTDIRAEQEAKKENFGYYGKYAVWRDRSHEDIQAEIAKGTPWVLRFRSEGSLNNKIKFTDLIKGDLELTENDIDHVLLKSDGIPTYHFAHAVDDWLMRTTHVVRGDEWLPSLPFHLQLHSALGFKWLKYAHIGTLMKMDGTSKRKLSKRKDPELGLTYYREQGYPEKSVYEYIMTILNSNFEDWRRANTEIPATDFKFSVKKMNPAGSLFDVNKLRDVSKDVIARMTADEVYEETAEWAKDFDGEFYDLFTANPDYSKAILSIGRGGKKPRKDFAVWSEVREGISFFFEPLFERQCSLPDGMNAKNYAEILQAYYDYRIDYYKYQRQANRDLEPEQCELPTDASLWFDEVKAIGEKLGYCPDTKQYKENPDAWKGSAADVAMALRVAICGRQQSPDLYSVMKIIGMDSFMGRIHSAISMNERK